MYLLHNLRQPCFTGRLGKGSVEARHHRVVRWVSCPFDDTKVRKKSGKTMKFVNLLICYFSFLSVNCKVEFTML